MGYMGGYEAFSPQYDAAASTAAGVGGFLLVFMLLFYLLAFGWSILVYVLESLSMYAVAKRRGIHNPWLAWVPVGSAWILGSISDQYQYLSKGKVRNRRKVLLGLNIATIAASVLMMVMAFAMGISAGLSEDFGAATGAALGASFAGMLLFYVAIIIIALVHTVFWYIALYDLYASCEPSNAVLYLVLSVIINVTLPFFMFACRKKDLGMPPRRQETAQPPVLPQPEPVEEVPVEEVPVEEVPVEEIPVEEASAEEPPVVE